MRKLATIQLIEEIKPVEGADKIEAVRVKGWWVVVKKGEFKVGDICVFFEIDSLVPKIPVFSFLDKNGTKKIRVIGELNKPNFEVEGYRIKTVKFKKQISQGLVMPISAFPELISKMEIPMFNIGEDVSEKLGVYKYEHYVEMSSSEEIKGSFPPYVPKTDEERIQNCYSEIIKQYIGCSFTITEKLDGVSCSIIRNDDEFHVCSRNISLKKTKKNIYWNIAKKYSLHINMPNNYAIQGEIVGEKIQSNRLGLVDRDLYIFYIYDIKSATYLSFDETKNFCKEFNLKTVPLIDNNWILTPEIKCDDIIKMANGSSLLNPKALREGIVFRLNNRETEKISFKSINNNYILKWGL